VRVQRRLCALCSTSSAQPPVPVPRAAHSQQRRPARSAHWQRVQPRSRTRATVPRPPDCLTLPRPAGRLARSQPVSASRPARPAENGNADSNNKIIKEATHTSTLAHEHRCASGAALDRANCRGPAHPLAAGRCASRAANRVLRCARRGPHARGRVCGRPKSAALGEPRRGTGRAPVLGVWMRAASSASGWEARDCSSARLAARLVQPLRGKPAGLRAARLAAESECGRQLPDAVAAAKRRDREREREQERQRETEKGVRVAALLLHLKVAKCLAWLANEYDL